MHHCEIPAMETNTKVSHRATPSSKHTYQLSKDQIYSNGSMGNTPSVSLNDASCSPSTATSSSVPSPLANGPSTEHLSSKFTNSSNQDTLKMTSDFISTRSNLSTSQNSSIPSIPSMTELDNDPDSRPKFSASVEFIPPSSFLAKVVLKLRHDIINSSSIIQNKPIDKSLDLKYCLDFDLKIDSSTLKYLNTSVKANTSFVKKMKSFPDGLSAQQKEGLLNELMGLSCSRYIDEILDSALRFGSSGVGMEGGTSLNVFDMTSMSSSFNASSVSSMMNNGPTINGTGGPSSSCGYVSASGYGVANALGAFGSTNVVSSSSNTSYQNMPQTQNNVSTYSNQQDTTPSGQKNAVDNNVTGQNQVKELSNEDFAILLSIFTVLYLRYDSFISTLLSKLKNSRSQLHIRDKLKLYTCIYLLGMDPNAMTGTIDILEKLSDKEISKSSAVVNSMQVLTIFVECFGEFFFLETRKKSEDGAIESENIAERDNESSQSPTSTFIDGYTLSAISITSLVPENMKSRVNSIFSKFIQLQEKRMQQGLKKLQSMTEKLYSSTSFGDEKDFDVLLKARRSWLKFYTLTEAIADICGIALSGTTASHATEMKVRLEEIEFAKQLEEEAENSRDEFDDDPTRAFYRDIPEFPVLSENFDKGNNNNDKLQNVLNDLKTNFGTLTFNQWVNDFAPFNKSKNRDKIVQIMFQVKRTNLHLLPLYSRLVRVFFPLFPDVGRKLSKLLLEEFEQLFAKKDQIELESRIKNIRFIAELTKFEIIPSSTTLNLLSKCLTNFTHYNINVACALLDSCGRYLLLNHESKKPMKRYLAQLVRLRNIKNLDEANTLMIDNIIYTVNIEAARAAQLVEEVKPPVYRYILHILYTHLDAKHCNQITKKILKLDWNIPETTVMMIEIFQKLRSSKYDRINMIASIVADISHYYPKFAMTLIDRLIEDIRSSLVGEIEQNQQQRLVDVKFLGELFVHYCIDYSLVITMLYMLLRYASNSGSTEDTFRIRLICTLLESAAKNLTSNHCRLQCHRFILYLQAFVLNREARLPVDVECILMDTLDLIQADLKWPKKEIALKKIAALEKVQPAFIPSKDLISPVLKNQTKVNIRDEDFEQFLKIEDEREKEIQNQMKVEMQLEEMKFEREMQQMIQQDATERRIKRITQKSDNQKSEIVKSSLHESKPSIVVNGEKKMVLMLRKK